MEALKRKQARKVDELVVVEVKLRKVKEEIESLSETQTKLERSKEDPR